MTFLVIAEHDNNSIKSATLNTVTAASHISLFADGQVHLLVMGQGAHQAAEAATHIAGIAKVIHADGAALAHGLAENMAAQVLAVDLDLFKQVNDTWGHAAGDAVLQHAAALMRQVTRQHDLVARSGGEEFTLVLPDTGVDDAQALAERLRDWLQTQPVQHQGRPLMVTVSIGVGLIEPADANVDAVLARADNALYQAKSAGRNRVCLAPAAALRAD